MQAVMVLNVTAAASTIFLDGQRALIAGAIAVTCSVLVLLVALAATRVAVNDMQEHLDLFEQARDTSRQIEELFAMTDMLQAAEDHDDAGAVLMATAHRLLPEYGGALYVFNNSRDRLDLTKAWNSIRPLRCSPATAGP